MYLITKHNVEEKQKNLLITKIVNCFNWFQETLCCYTVTNGLIQKIETTMANALLQV